MKNNKFSLVAMIALGGLITCAPLAKADPTNSTPPADSGAPKPKGGKGGGNGPMMEAIKKMDLNAEQKEKVQGVFKGQQEKMQEIRKDTTLSREDKMAKMKELRENMKEEMKKILTPEQYTQFEEAMKNMGPGARRAGAGGAAAAAAAAGGVATPSGPVGTKGE